MKRSSSRFLCHRRVFFVPFSSFSPSSSFHSLVVLVPFPRADPPQNWVTLTVLCPIRLRAENLRLPHHGPAQNNPDRLYSFPDWPFSVFCTRQVVSNSNAPGFVCSAICVQPFKRSQWHSRWPYRLLSFMARFIVPPPKIIAAPITHRRL